MEVFDKEKRAYMPTGGGLGMHVEVRDPDDKTLMSRVSSVACIFYLIVYLRMSSPTCQFM